MCVLRWTLCRLYQDRRVKVSLFLQEGLQLADGTIVINHQGTLPNGAEQVGKVTYYDMDSDEEKVSKETCFKLNNTMGTTPAKSPAFSMKSPNTNRTCELGLNLYSADRRKNAEGKVATRSDNAMPLQKGYEAKEEAKAQAKAELNHLADMLGGMDKKSMAKDNFNVVSLFPEAQLVGGGSGGKTAEVITFDADDVKKYKNVVNDLASEFDNLSAGGDDDDDSEDDLLALMDAA